MVPRRDEPARRAREGVAGTTSSALDAADVQAAMPPAWLWIAGGNPYLRIRPWRHPGGARGHLAHGRVARLAGSDRYLPHSRLALRQISPCHDLIKYRSGP